jgi:hypothetical protein
MFSSLFKYLLCLTFAVFLTGCATENEHLAKLPLFEAKSDRIPGLQSPRDRVKQIRLKGEKGAKAKDEEKEILVAQLMVEYRTCPDMNMRREAVDALAKIKHSKRDEYMLEILKDSDALVRIAALEAIGTSFEGGTGQLAAFLIDKMQHDTDKDVRLTAVRLLGQKFPYAFKERPEHITVERSLCEMLNDKVPAVRYETMQSLHRVTGKDYGNNINRWLEYAQSKTLSAEPPKERTWAEKIPRPQLPMLK